MQKSGGGHGKFYHVKNRGRKNARKPFIDNVHEHNDNHNSKVNKNITTSLAGGGRHTHKMLTCSWLNNM